MLGIPLFLLKAVKERRCVIISFKIKRKTCFKNRKLEKASMYFGIIDGLRIEKTITIGYYLC